MIEDCDHKWEKRWVVTKRKAENVNEGGCIPGTQDMINVKLTRRKVCIHCGRRKYTMFPIVRRTKKFKQLMPYATKPTDQRKRASKQPGVF